MEPAQESWAVQSQSWDSSKVTGPACELRNRIRKNRELTTGVHVGISRAKTEGGTLQQGMRSGSSIQFTPNHIHCTRAWAALPGASDSKGRSLGGKRRKGLAADAAQAEAN